MSNHVAFSVDLETHKNRSLDSICDAMAWFDWVVDRETVFPTYRIADELPGLITGLAPPYKNGFMSAKRTRL